VDIWYSEEGPERAAAIPGTLLAVPNVTAHPSTASVHNIRCDAIKVKVGLKVRVFI